MCIRCHQTQFQNVSPVYIEAMKEKSVFGNSVNRRTSTAAVGQAEAVPQVPVWVRMQATE